MLTRITTTHRLLLQITALMGLMLLLVGCQTTRYQGFENVREGMGKSDVIEAVGGPNRTERWHGKDRWTYFFANTPDGPQAREVQFENGKAIYVGAGVRSEVSAEEQDRLNEESNAQEAETALAKPAAPGSSVAKDRIDLYIEESLYGISNPEREKKKRAPVFEEIQ